MSSHANPPKLKAPPGACDTHMHFYGARYPTAKTCHAAGRHADYRMMQARLGLTRNVVVQPTTCGTHDDAIQWKILADNPDRLYGF